MGEALFCALDSEGVAALVRGAEHSVCYAAPGLQLEPARAMAGAAGRIGPELITVCLDFDEHVLRMGFGELEAVKLLREAGIAVRSTPGLRTGLVIVDQQGFIFTPTALYLEAEGRAEAAPNAMRLSAAQATEALARLSPAAKAIAAALARTPEERRHIEETAVEVPSEPVEDAAVETVQRSLQAAPPAPFDVTRQVRVFSAYLQYVELSLKGAAIQRKRLPIPARIQQLGGAEELQKRLRTTVDLIEPDGKLSSKPLETKLKQLRDDFTRSLGKDQGRVLLKARKALFEERIAQLRAELAAHQKEVEEELQGQLDASRAQIVEYFLPRVVANPPDAMRGQLFGSGEDDARRWLDMELGKVFPTAQGLIEKMTLTVVYKDVTFETLNAEDFIEKVKQAYPVQDWDKTYQDSLAAKERAPSERPADR